MLERVATTHVEAKQHQNTEAHRVSKRPVDASGLMSVRLRATRGQLFATTGWVLTARRRPHRAEVSAYRFVLITTDKAVNPNNVMGATKRAAETVVSMMTAEHAGRRFMAVRFGNVLRGRRSVIPKFKEQTARGGPVAVTHSDIIRYFTTIPEAARLVMQPAVIGESGQALVLEMGEPVRIVDLARDLIRLSGHSLDRIPIVFPGLRPGEKLLEELLADEHASRPTPIARLRIAKLFDNPGGVDELMMWIQGAAAGDVNARQQLTQALAGFVLRHS